MYYVNTKCQRYACEFIFYANVKFVVLFLPSVSRGMVSVLHSLSFLFQPHLLNFPPFGWSADPDHTQKQSLSGPVRAFSEPPQRFETPLKTQTQQPGALVARWH